MTASERFGNFMRGKPVDRLPVVEWAPWWNLTIDRWHTEGLPGELKRLPGQPRSVLDIQRYFGLDGCVQTYFFTRSHESPQPKSHGAGIVKNEEDYHRFKPTFYKPPSLYMPKEHIDWLKKTRAEGDVIHFFSVEGFFWMPREMFGIEDHLYSFYDYPELLHEMCSDHAEWVREVCEYVGNNFKFDFMSFAEDMSYNNGPMLGKDVFDEFLLPYYKRTVPLLKQLDIPVYIDSDGDITKAVDWYAEAGADGMFPLERQAGVDVGVYLEMQPKMYFLGHFDKMCMKKGEAAMRAEFERLLPSMRSGRLLPSVDHQTPPDVSIDNYRIYVRLLKEYAEKAVK